MRTELTLPRLDDMIDPLDHLQDFHDAIRDVVGWAHGIVDAEGHARPDDARLLRAFLGGPLRDHLADEGGLVVPSLRGRRGSWLDGALSSTERGHAALERAASALTPLIDELARGAAVDADVWQEAVSALTREAERALRFEDDVMLPTARLLLDQDERHALAVRLLEAAAARPLDTGLLEVPPPRARRLGVVRTHGAGGSRTRVYADCPRRCTVDVEHTCTSCRFFEDIDRRGGLHCNIEETAAAARVGDVMTRDVHCVSRDVPASRLVGILAEGGVRGVPVIDDDGAPVGVISQTDLVQALARHADLDKIDVGGLMMHAPFVVYEDTSIDDAARLLAYEGIHRLPVINAERHVVGIVSALDLVRWSCAHA